MEMKQSFEKFKGDLERFRADAEKTATRRLRRYSLKALEMIVMGTPVLTGCCRANWFVSIGELSRLYDSGKKDASGGETISVGAAVIASATLKTDVLIENSCPYVMALEYGWSRQAPGGMVRKTQAALVKAIKEGAR